MPIKRVYLMSIFYGNFDKFAESLSVTNRQKNTASKRGRFEELGQMKIDLDYNMNKVSVNISALPQGIYTYKYIVSNVQKQAGKLLIE